MSVRRLFAAVLVLAAAGCGRPFGNTERRIEARLPELVGPAEEYRVQLSRSTAGALRGRMRWMNVTGRNVELSPGVNVDRVDLRLEGIRADRRWRRLREIRKAEIKLELSEASLNRALDQRSPDFRDVQITLTSGRIRVVAPGPLVDAEGPVTIEGEPVLTTPTTLYWKRSRVAVGEFEVPDAALRKLEAAFNPLVDLSKLKYPVRLTHVAIGEGNLTVSGAASLTAEDLEGVTGSPKPTDAQPQGDQPRDAAGGRTP